MVDRKDIHARVLNAGNKQELAEAYKEWAEQYDEDLVGSMGYIAPELACKMLQHYVDNMQAEILDAGCGTGLVGECLHRQGYTHLQGLDYSPEMLAKARDKGIYSRLHQGDLTVSLDLPDAAFDAVISVGTFTCGHVGPEAFEELLRVTRPGGILCVVVRDRAWEEDRYHQAMAAITQRGLWQCLEEKTADYIQEEGSACQICVYRKTD